MQPPPGSDVRRRDPAQLLGLCRSNVSFSITTRSAKARGSAASEKHRSSGLARARDAGRHRGRTLLPAIQRAHHGEELGQRCVDRSHRPRPQPARGDRGRWPAPLACPCQPDGTARCASCTNPSMGCRRTTLAPTCSPRPGPAPPRMRHRRTHAAIAGADAHHCSPMAEMSAATPPCPRSFTVQRVVGRVAPCRPARGGRR